MVTKELICILPDKGVHFCNIDVVEFLDSSFNVVLVRAGVNNEY